MTKADRISFVIFLGVVLLSGLFALAGSQGGLLVSGLPLFALAVGLIFLIQWLVFIPAFVYQTEKYFDLTGGLTYIFVILLTAYLAGAVDGRSILMVVLVVIWAARLGFFLFRRIQKAGKDDRFDELKPNFFRFLNVWTIQGLWISLTLAAALVVITSTSRKELDLFALAGFVVWVIGFAIEVVADWQKSVFRENPENKGKFIQTGLWARSRHPNYFGEIVLWIGVMIIALPVLQGWQWVGLASPLFVILLLTRVSGIPLLEKKADEKWGGQEVYETYKKNTPVLIPRL